MRIQAQNWRDAQAHLNDAIDLHSADQFEAALHEIDLAIRHLDQGTSVFLATKGRILHSLGHLEEAEKTARKATELNSELKTAWSVLGESLLDMGRNEEAAAALTRAVEIEESFSTYTILAATELQFDPKAAEAHARRALELNPDWEEAETILQQAKRLAKR